MALVAQAVGAEVTYRDFLLVRPEGPEDEGPTPEQLDRLFGIPVEREASGE